MSAKASTPTGDRRAVGPVSVYKPEDLESMGYKTLSDRTEVMIENRCEIFIHNVQVLCKRYNISQAQLCATKLENFISPPQLAGYKKRGKDIPYRVFTMVANAFGLTVEELCGQLLDPESADSEPGSGESVGRSIEEYEKYVGTYDLAYFDTSKPLGENSVPTSAALDNAVLTIYATYNAIGVASFHVAAIFNCTASERMKAAALMEGFDLSHNGNDVLEAYKSVVQFTNPSDKEAASRIKCLYAGDIHLTDRMVEITLRQVKGSDTAYILAHNRAATSSEGKMYKGGLITLMSSSRGEEHMPCMQAALMLRGTYAEIEDGGKIIKKIPQSRLDAFAKEALAQKIYLNPPMIKLGQEIQDIVTYMKFLFMQNNDQSAIVNLSDEDKTFCLESFVEKKLTESLRRNCLSYYKIAVQMDSDVYQMTRQS